MTDRPLSAGGKRPVVTIVYKSLPLYRIPFFEGLRHELHSRGAELRLIYGQPPAPESARRDTGELPWGHPVKNRIVNVGNRFLCWQPCLHLLADSSLVIVEQASKMLNNYLLALKPGWYGPRIAYWGHGKCLMARGATRAGEAVKRAMSLRAHWWFAYNERSAQIVRNLGFPEQRITVVQNTIETGSLIGRRLSTERSEIDTLRRSLGLNGDNVGIYAGGVYAEKRIEFLLEAAFEVRKRVADFELLVLGAGPLQGMVERVARENQWVHYVGPRFNEEKVPFFMLAKALLIPGAVGLAVIDSFAFEVPLVTVDLWDHGPELDYVSNGENGLILKRETTPAEYAAAVASVMLDGPGRERLQEGCRQSAKRYTLETMVDNFSDGVMSALAR